MEIKNKDWLPLVGDYAHMANVSVIALVYVEDTDAAGMYDPDENCIVINIAPNVLAEVADRYLLKPSELEKIAMAVFLEECVHSRGIDDETTAAAFATMLLTMIPEEKFKTRCNMVSYVKSVLSNINKDVKAIEGSVTIAL